MGWLSTIVLYSSADPSHGSKHWGLPIIQLHPNSGRPKHLTANKDKGL